MFDERDGELQRYTENLLDCLGCFVQEYKKHGKVSSDKARKNPTIVKYINRVNQLWRFMYSNYKDKIGRNPEKYVGELYRSHFGSQVPWTTLCYYFGLDFDTY